MKSIMLKIVAIDCVTNFEAIMKGKKWLYSIET
jgi:hypothetical protein